MPRRSAASAAVRSPRPGPSPLSPSPGRPQVRSPARCPTCPSVMASLRLLSAGSPDPRQRSFEPGSSPIRPVIREPLAGEPASGPGFLLPFGHRHSLLGPSCARWGIRLSSRSAYRQANRRTPSGLSCSACDRCGRGGRPLNPGDDGALPASQIRPAGTRRLPAAGPCSPAFCLPPAEVLMTRRHRGFTHVHPSGLPQPVVSRVEREPLGLSPGFAPCSYPQRTPGRGRSLRTGPGATSPTSADLPSTSATRHMRPHVAPLDSARRRAPACGS